MSLDLNEKQEKIVIEIDKNSREADGYSANFETEDSIFSVELREEDGFCECCGREGEVYYLKDSNFAVGICLLCFKNEYDFVKGIYPID